MKKLLRLLLRFSLLLFFVIAGFLLLNFLRFSSRQVLVEPITPISISPQAKERLAASARIPTISHYDHIDTTAFEELHLFLDSIYRPVNEQLERYTVNGFSRVYRWAGKNPNLKPILFLAHLDVVPIESKSKAEWKVAPFSGKIDEEFIWGRGTLDDKMNALGMLEAIQLLLEEGYQPERSIFLAYGHDEEVGGKYGAQAIAQRFKQQGLEFEFILDEGMLVVEGALPGLAAPACLIGVAEKGYTTLNISIDIKEGGHSSMPGKETAIGILAGALHRLESHPFPAQIKGVTGELFDYVGPEMNTLYKTVFANRWLFGGILKSQLSGKPGPNATIRTTTAPTILRAGMKDNVLPSSAEGQVNFRIIPGESAETVIDYVNKVIADDRVVVKEQAPATTYNPSQISATDAFGFTVLQKTASQIFPEAIVAPALMVGATDSRHYTELSDNIYRFSPVHLLNSELKLIHGINERVSIENYERLIRFYHQLLLNSCN